ncbi:MAG: methyltransferase family protein, partial [Chthoniobacterales bacterium]
LDLHTLDLHILDLHTLDLHTLDLHTLDLHTLDLHTLDLRTAAIGAVALGWIAFLAVFVFRKRPPQTAERARDRTSWIGLILQGLGLGLASWSTRPMGALLIPGAPAWVEPIMLLSGVALMAASVWLVMAAVRTLGKNWSLAARVITDHELIATGPYAVVRHPIYTGMLGMLIADGLVFGTWYSLLAGLAIYWAGAALRTRREEALLRGTFGAAYDDYARRVHPLVPGLRIG